MLRHKFLVKPNLSRLAHFLVLFGQLNEFWKNGLKTCSFLFFFHEWVGPSRVDWLANNAKNYMFSRFIPLGSSQSIIRSVICQNSVVFLPKKKKAISVILCDRCYLLAHNCIYEYFMTAIFCMNIQMWTVLPCTIVLSTLVFA